MHLKLHLHLFLVLVLISLCFGQSTSKNEIVAGTDFVRLGSFTTTKLVAGGSIQKSDYYLHDAPTSWDAAVTRCRTQLNGSLVAFDTPSEKVDNLDDRPGDTYWTSGMYSSNSWNWFVDDFLYPFPPSGIAWGSGHPKPGNPFLKVAYTRIDNFNSYFTTVPGSALLKSICEVNSESLPVPCFKLNDLAIVLDSFGSIGLPNFDIAKTFVAKLASAFTVYDPSRLTLIIYSSAARIEVPLNNNLTPTEIDAIIMAALYDAGGTATAEGIDLAVKELVDNNRGAPRSLVVLTDGQSNSPPDTIAAANKAIQQGIQTFSVGIANAQQTELLAIAGGNSGNVFNAKTFDELIQIIAPLSAKLCPA